MFKRILLSHNKNNLIKNNMSHRKWKIFEKLAK